LFLSFNVAAIAMRTGDAVIDLHQREMTAALLSLANARFFRAAR
jgi:hypothetical protein